MLGPFFPFLLAYYFAYDTAYRLLKRYCNRHPYQGELEERFQIKTSLALTPSNFAFMQRWRFVTRMFSTLNALIMTFGCLYVFYRSGTDVFKWDYLQTNPDMAENVYALNFILCSYLIIDAFYLMTNITVFDEGEAILHHVIGTVGMFLFVYRQRLAFNSIYFMFTEATTIFLNVGWFVLHSETKSTAFKAIGYFAYAILAILWTIIRIGGSAISICLGVLHIDIMFLELGISGAIQFWVLNGIMLTLNIFWYIKIIRKGIETCSKECGNPKQA